MATLSEVLILKVLSVFEKIDEISLLQKIQLHQILDESQLKNSISDCLVKDFAEKLNINEKSFYKITKEGLKHI